MATKNSARTAAEAGLDLGPCQHKSLREEGSQHAVPRGWYTEEGCNLEEFKALTSRKTDAGALKFTSKVEKNIPVYDCSKLLATLDDPESKRSLQAEWNWIFMSGPGVLIFQNAYTDTTAIDEATKVFNDIISEQRQRGGGGDHFAKNGVNDRIWNSLQKLCLNAPDVFARYWSNPFMDAVNEAWLGPGYQMTSQVNVVRCGGQAQEPHRDYHLGFQAVADVCKWPAHAHVNLSPQLTLQGGVAHVDVPIESGPTYLLPFSQLYPPGYMAWRRPDFKEYFMSNYVQLPLKKGDMLFFNPALFHAGGENRTSGDSSVQRMVNLTQASSAFGRSMESVDRLRMTKALFPALSKTYAANPSAAKYAVKACAEGYSFPSNMDLDVPETGAMCPLTQQGLFLRALEEGWTSEAFNAGLDAQKARQQA